eukprot:gene27179-2419_t
MSPESAVAVADSLASETMNPNTNTVNTTATVTASLKGVPTPPGLGAASAVSGTVGAGGGKGPLTKNQKKKIKKQEKAGQGRFASGHKERKSESGGPQSAWFRGQERGRHIGAPPASRARWNSGTAKGDFGGKHQRAGSPCIRRGPPKTNMLMHTGTAISENPLAPLVPTWKGKGTGT